MEICRDPSSHPLSQSATEADMLQHTIPSGISPLEHCHPQYPNLIRWCFEPSQPQRITSGLKTNLSQAPTYSFHKSLYHKSTSKLFILQVIISEVFLFFPKPQLKFYPQFENAKPEKRYCMFWSLFIFREHSTWEPASSGVTYLILQAYTGTSVSQS